MNRKSVVARLTGALISWCLLVPGANAQNLVPNPDFSQGFPPPSWTSATDGMCASCAVQIDNSNGHPTTPSIRLVSSHPGNAGQILASACIAYGSGIYDFGAFVRNNGSHVNAASAVSISFWSGATCDVGFLAFEQPASIGTVGSWMQHGVNAYDPPGTSGYVIISLQSRLNGNLAGTADFSFDRVYFAVSDPIFSNGFE